MPFYQRRELAFLPFAGTEDTSRSHFETQNRIELGQGLDKGGAGYGSGFLNRLAGVLGDERGQAAAFTEDVPQICRGAAHVPNVDLGGASRQSRLNDKDNQAIASMYRRTELNATVAEGQRIMSAARQEMDAEMQAANGNAVSADRLEQEARRIARFMRDQYNLGFVDVGGWDTHVGQGGASGALATRLGQLGRALAAYADAMGDAWKRTTVVVISEFGRTFRENGNKGTDHGHGTVLGDGRRGARRAHRRPPGRGAPRHPVPGPRLPGAERVPRRLRRPVRAPVRTGRGAAGAGVSGRAAAGPETGLNAAASPPARPGQRLISTMPTGHCSRRGDALF